MSPAEREFKIAVFSLILDGFYPGPAAIGRRLSYRSKSGWRLIFTHNLNGRECRWREQVFAMLGWKRVANRWHTLRTWQPPDGAELR